MFERFTRNAIQSIVLAQDECRVRGLALVGVEQLLLGLLALGEGLAFEVLSSRNITLSAVRSLLNGSVSGDTAAIGGEVPLAVPAEQVLVQASLESVELFNESTGTEHILLSLLREDAVLRLFEKLGVSAEELKTEVWRSLLTIRLGACNEQQEKALIYGQVGRLYYFLGRREDAVYAYKKALSLPGGQVYSQYLDQCPGVEA
ncbi:MAG: Clp protease N-terminal domain-containing protein [Candidatus Obscuribacter sp.]|nr:Clp protease N-terminal domain-containing protein [Candidatus Obscuribacter sp.]